MLPYMSASQIYPVGQVTVCSSHDRLHISTSTSPKSQELRARYESIQAAANKNAGVTSNLSTQKT
jgi:hypothetical protein